VDALGNGARTIPEIVKVIYADIPEKLHAMAGMSVHSHLKKLEQDGRVAKERITCTPSRWTLL
jgi:Beta-lactamase associated winged helix domain